MKPLLFSLLLALSLPLAPAMAAQPAVQIFTASAEGSLTIGTDGRVIDVSLDRDEDLGDAVMDAFEQRIRAWRFQPIVENGQPIKVKGLMRLSLAAAREKGNDTATFAIRNVHFLDPPEASPATPATPGPSMTQPTYPDNAVRAGVGARVMLLVKMGAEGRPDRVATERLELLGTASRGARLHFVAAQFRRSAELATERWTFPGHQEGELLRIPVWYTVEQWSRGWVPTSRQPVDLPAWAVVELAHAEARELLAGGGETAARFKLLTPLDDA